ncbi:MAG: formylglycine-generating enzyme family protein [Treponema sp.]
MNEKNPKMIEIPADSEQKFSLAEVPVTQELYMDVIGTNPSEYKGKTESLQQPVECVSWYDALIFCNALSLRENLVPYYTLNGKTNPAEWGESPKREKNAWQISVDSSADGYRLPTAEEWNTAIVKAADYTDENIRGRAWTSETSGNRPQNVAGKQADRFGLYDMIGNVWEWCMDAGTGEGTRTCCGGAFCTSVNSWMSAKTERHAHTRYTDCGFRLCRNIKTEEKAIPEENRSTENSESAPEKAPDFTAPAAHENEAAAHTVSSEKDKARILELTHEKKNLKIASTIGWILFSAVAILAFYLNSTLQEEIVFYSDSYRCLIDENDEVLSALQTPAIIVVTSISNRADNSTYLAHEEITYLRFEFTVLKRSNIWINNDFYIKIIDPYNRLSTGKSSPEGYTRSEKMHSSLFLWGSDTAGYTYSTPGTWTIEFWYEDYCVGRQVFEIH